VKLTDSDSKCQKFEEMHQNERAKLIALNGTLEEMVERISQLEFVLKAANEAQQTSAQLLEEKTKLVEKLNAEKLAFEAELNDTRAIAHEWEEYASQQAAEAKCAFDAEWAIKLEELKQERDALQMQVDGLLQETISTQHYQAELSQMVQKLDSSILENEQLRIQLDANHQDKEISQSYSELQLRYAYLQCQNELVLTEINDKEYRISELNDAVNGLKEQQEKTRAELDRHVSRATELTDEVENLTTKLITSAELLALKEHESISYKQELAIKVATIEHLEEDIRLSKVEFTKQYELLNELKIKLEDSHNATSNDFSLVVLERQVCDLEAEKVQLEVRCAELESELEGVAQQLKDAELIVQEWTSYASQLEQERDQSKLEIEKLTEQVNTAARERENNAIKMADLAAQSESQMAELSRFTEIISDKEVKLSYCRKKSLESARIWWLLSPSWRR
jgi:chromosome segregation ATPase